MLKLHAKRKYFIQVNVDFSTMKKVEKAVQKTTGQKSITSKTAEGIFLVTRTDAFFPGKPFAIVVIETSIKEAKNWTPEDATILMLKKLGFNISGMSDEEYKTFWPEKIKDLKVKRIGDVLSNEKFGIVEILVMPELSGE